MLQRVIITRVVLGKRTTRTITFDRYYNTLNAALREGARLLRVQGILKAEVENPETRKITHSRSRGDPKWTVHDTSS